ncbi:efflux transporter outer membrane subunit [Limibacter armeniacum]|uniref:efflux transporter outer membrane subunit n=1 Tax=Limibacter armeniacum TaxID=466084 RepID=UPI002FE63D15
MLLLIVGMVSSCKLGPNYMRTADKLPNHYRQSFSSEKSIANLPWWELFQDSVLTDLIEKSLEQNRDLAVAFDRIRTAEASMGIVRADLYPRVNYVTDASATFTTVDGGDSESVIPDINIAYQVDLWGRYRRLSEAAFQEYLATEEAYKTLTLSLVAQVATSYLTLRDLDNRLRVASRTADTWQKNLDIVQARFNGGFVSEVDLNQARIQLTEALTAIQQFKRLRVQTENTISLLLGEYSQEISRGQELNEQQYPDSLPTGLPSELLDRRPDVLAAEKRLHAQTERIGVAEALKYPSFTLSTDLGWQLVDPTYGFAALGAQILGPIFNSGANQKRVVVEKTVTAQLFHGYEQTYLNALREVEDAMIAVETYRVEYDLRREQVQAAEQAASLSWVRYEGGLTSYLEVLDLQRSLFNSQLRASESLRLHLTSIVQLYQALGGGWSLEQENELQNRYETD